MSLISINKVSLVFSDDLLFLALNLTLQPIRLRHQSTSRLDHKIVFIIPHLSRKARYFPGKIFILRSGGISFIVVVINNTNAQTYQPLIAISGAKIFITNAISHPLFIGSGHGSLNLWAGNNALNGKTNEI